MAQNVDMNQPPGTIMEKSGAASFMTPLMALLWIVLVGVLSLVSIESIRREAETEVRNGMRTVLQFTRGNMNEWVNNNMRGLANAASASEFKTAAAELSAKAVSGGAEAGRAGHKRALEILHLHFGEKPGYRFALVSGAGGRIVSLTEGNDLKIAGAEADDIFLNNLLQGESGTSAKGKWYFPDNDKSADKTISGGFFVFGQPVKDESGRVIAALIMGTDLGRGLTRITQMGRIGQTGETYAFDKTGLMLSESRFNEHLYQAGLIKPGSKSAHNQVLRDPGGDTTAGYRTIAREKTPLTRMARDAVKRLDGEDMKGYRDYRGVEVVGVWIWAEELGMGLVTEIDTPEAFNSFFLTRRIIIMIMGATTGLTLMMYMALLGGSRQTATMARTALLSNELLRKEAAHREKAEEDLKASEKRLQGMMDNTTSVIYMKDTQGKYVHVNRRFLRLFHVTPENVIGKTDFDIFPKKVASAFRTNDLTVLNTGELLEMEETAPQQDGEHTYISIKFPIYGEDGKLLGVSGVSTDITGRKRAEMALKESERRFRRMLEDVRQISVMLDGKGNLTFVNDYLLELTGYRWEEVIGQNWFDMFVPSEIRDQVKARFARLIRGEEESLKNNENEILTSSGERRLVTWNNTELLDADGRIIGTASMGLDVTGQRQAAAALAVSERRFQDVAQISGDWIWEVDADGKITYSSQIVENILGYGAEEILGKYYWDLFDPEEAKIQKSVFQDPIEARRPFVNTPTTLVHKNGAIVLAEASGAPVIGVDEGFLGYRGATRDMTKRIMAERRLKESQDSLNKAQAIAHLGAWDWDIVTNDLAWSDEVYRIFGLEPQQFGATYPAFLERVHPEDREKVSGAVNGAVAGNEPYFIEHRVVRPDGSIRTVTEQGEVYRDFDGKPLRMVGVAQDVTARKVAQRALVESRQSLERAQKVGKMGSWELNLVTNEVSWSEQIDEIYGFDKSTPQSMEKFWKVVYPEDIPLVEQNIREAFRGDKSVAVDYRVIHPAGKIHVVRSIAEVFFGPDGKPEKMMGVAQDVTDRKKAEEELHLAAQVFDSSLDGIMVIDKEEKIRSVNKAFGALTGYAQEEVLGQGLDFITALRRNETAGVCVKALWEEVRKNGFIKGEIWCLRKNGREFPVWIHINRIAAKSAAGERYVAIFHDVTEAKEREREIQYHAYYDALTGLPNRVLLQDRLKMAVARAKREKEIFALMFLDLDNFKNINDSLGHDVGDLLLKGVSVRLVESLREIDTVARIGGDEFVILLEKLVDQGEAVRVARKIIKTLGKSFLFQDKPMYATGSLGITIFPDDGEDVDTLVKNADMAMYKAKEMGKSGFQLFTSDMNEKFTSRLALENSLRESMEKDAFVVHYQPKMDIPTGAITGMEALVRWIKPDGTIVSPSDFIPLAEETGLILKIGETVLRKSLKRLAMMNQQMGAHLRISVNLSAKQFGQGDVVRMVSNALRDSGVDPGLLELEITESSVMMDVDGALEKMKALKKLGVKLSIDDFGTGFSSLGYLRKFPIDVLKIDKSFVTGMTGARADAAIVSSIISIAKNLGLKVIAEGVETQEHLDMLRNMGCDEIQGFLISPPVPEDRIVEVIESLARQRALT